MVVVGYGLGLCNCGTETLFSFNKSIFIFKIRLINHIIMQLALASLRSIDLQELIQTWPQIKHTGRKRRGQGGRGAASCGVGGGVCGGLTFLSSVQNANPAEGQNTSGPMKKAGCHEETGSARGKHFP